MKSICRESMTLFIEFQNIAAEITLKYSKQQIWGKQREILGYMVGSNF